MPTWAAGSRLCNVLRRQEWTDKDCPGLRGPLQLRLGDSGHPDRCDRLKLQRRQPSKPAYIFAMSGSF